MLISTFCGLSEGLILNFLLEMFLEFHPNAQIIPLASTGAASRIVYESEKNKLNPRFELDPRFENDYTYSSLFRRLFHNHLKN